jgi:hypothetical protein
VHSSFLCSVFFVFVNFCFVCASARAVFVFVLKINDCPAVGWLERGSATNETRLVLFFFKFGCGGKGGWRALTSRV